MWRKRINLVVIVLTSLLVIGVLVPMIQLSRETARRTQSARNLKQIGQSLYNYIDSYEVFPPGGIFNHEGRGFHGWMTSIIPYVESSPLWNSIDVNEPWDSTRNAGTFLTKYHLYENPGDPLPPRKWEFPLAQYSANAFLLAVNSSTKPSLIEDTSRVFLAGELGGDFLPWGCPYNWRELDGLNSNPPTYGRSTRDGCQFVFVDGRVEFVANEVSAKILKRMKGDDLAGFKTNEIQIQRPATFPCPEDALQISWRWAGKDNDSVVTVRQDIHGKQTTERRQGN